MRTALEQDHGPVTYRIGSRDRTTVRTSDVLDHFKEQPDDVVVPQGRPNYEQMPGQGDRLKDRPSRLSPGVETHHVASGPDDRSRLVT